MDEAWCLEKLENLRIKENRVETLNEIRFRLSDEISLEDIVTAKLLRSPEIYQCLEDDPASEQCDLAIDILSICLSHLTISQEDHSSLLLRSLQSNKPKVRAIALNTILKELTNQPNVILQEDLVPSIIDCVEVDNVSVGDPAVKILSIILSNKLDNGVVKNALLNKLQANSVVRCRIYEIAINLAKSSPANLVKVEVILNTALDELDGDDIVLQMDVLEMMVSLAEQNHGLVYLEQKQTFEKISNRVENIDERPLDRLLIPGIMKFFGKIAYSQPHKIITGYPRMIQFFFSCLHSGNPSLLEVVFDTLGNVAHSQQGKILLEANYSDSMRETFEDFITYLGNLSSELKIRAFNSLEVVFSCEGDVSHEASKVMEKWCRTLSGGEHLQFLMDFCRNPFPDIKVSCLNFIRAICHYRWGVVALKNTAGFVEYLLDRRVEFDKEAKYAKFQIIQILAESPVFDIQTQLQLKKYVNEGPYYMQAVVEIEVEGN